MVCSETHFSCFYIYLVRAALPRFRYDQLMQLNWKIILPFILALVYFLVSMFIIIYL
ncbi:MAG: NADH-quinone oxidoreductase subunit H [Nitrososphaeraceae archaeon]